MNMRLFVCAILIAPMLSYSQQVINRVDNENTGLKFENDLNWKQIKEKAKKEKKYIFVDVNASWCVPCKEMDKNVFPSNAVGKKMNDKFINVKFQMDTSKNDVEIIKKRYADAKKIYKEFKPTGYPTFLFFDPKGNIVHKGIGARNYTGFIELVNDALDTSKQYYTMLRAFNKGRRDSSFIQLFLGATNSLGGLEVARKTVVKIINGLRNEELFNKPNILMIKLYTNSSADRGYKMFYDNDKKVDSIMGMPDFASELIERVTYNEICYPVVKWSLGNNRTPDWENLSQSILKRKLKFPDKVLLMAKLRYSVSKKEWAAYSKILVEFVETYGSNSSNFLLNNNAWEVFKYSNSEKELKTALTWMERVFKSVGSEDPDNIDTYANLLYKVGKIDEAIQWEEKAIKSAPGREDLKKTLEKFRSLQPTWPAN